MVGWLGSQWIFLYIELFFTPWPLNVPHLFRKCAEWTTHLIYSVGALNGPQIPPYNEAAVYRVSCWSMHSEDSSSDKLQEVIEAQQKVFQWKR